MAGKKVDPNNQLVIINLSPGTTAVDMTTSLLSFNNWDRDNRKILEGLKFNQGTGLLGYHRSEALSAALKDFTAEWFMFIDSDMEFSPDDVYGLFDTARDGGYGITSGLYINYLDGRFKPLIYDFAIMSNGFAGMKERDTYEPDTITDCDGVPCGFMLLRRDMLEQMVQHFGPVNAWFTDGEFPGHVYQGEDLTFCRRARYLGWRVAVNTGIALNHVKKIKLSPSMVFSQDFSPSVTVETKKIKPKKRKSTKEKAK